MCREHLVFGTVAAVSLVRAERRQRSDSGLAYPADAADHRARAPWYTTKTQPSTADMAAKLRCVIIATRFKASRSGQPTPEEISVLCLAWGDAAA